jgi:hypothetical protein
MRTRTRWIVRATTERPPTGTGNSNNTPFSIDQNTCQDAASRRFFCPLLLAVLAGRTGPE